MTPPILNPDDLIHTLLGKASSQDLDRLGEALQHPASPALLRSLEDYFRSVNDPDAVNWEALLLQPDSDLPDEKERRTQIRNSVSASYREFWNPDSPLTLPSNRTIIDAACERLLWFLTMPAVERLQVYEIAAHELTALRTATLHTVAEESANAGAKTSATFLAQKLAKRNDLLSGLALVFPNHVRAFRLSEEAGRIPAEIAELLDTPEETVAQQLREIQVEIQVLDPS